MKKKSQMQKDFEEFYWGLIPQEKMNQNWNEISRAGNYKDLFTHAAFQCWVEATRREKDHARG